MEGYYLMTMKVSVQFFHVNTSFSVTRMHVHTHTCSRTAYMLSCTYTCTHMLTHVQVPCTHAHTSMHTHTQAQTRTTHICTNNNVYNNKNLLYEQWCRLAYTCTGHVQVISVGCEDKISDTLREVSGIKRHHLKCMLY